MLLHQNGSVINVHVGSLKKYNIFGIYILFADGIPCLTALWEWGHVLGIFFAWVAPSGPGTTELCPCPGVLHPSYVLAISRDVGTASGHSVTFSPGLLTGCGMCVWVCLHVCVYTCLYISACVVDIFVFLLSLRFFVLFCTLMFTLQ